MATSMNTAQRRPWWLGLAVMLLGAVCLYAASELAITAQYAGIGPGMLLLVIGAVFFLLGVLLLVQIARGEVFEPLDAENASAQQTMDKRAFTTALVAVVLPALIMQSLGLPITAMDGYLGILPGIGPALMIALLLPITISTGPVSAFIMFAGVLYGAMYGGSTTSILINTPGESGAMMTALATAAIGSFVAGTIATMLLTFAAPVVAELAFILTPADYFVLTVLAFTSVAVVMAAPGVMSYAMRVYGFPIPPLLIGLILVPLAENQLRTAMAAGQGNLAVLVQSPVSIVFLLSALLFLFAPMVLRRLRGG